MKTLQKLAEKNNLELVDITAGSNGYPSNTFYGIDASTFKNFNEVQQFAEKHKLTIVQLHRKDGWHFWEDKGQMYKPFEISSEDYGDDYQIIPKMDFETFFKDEVQFFFEDTRESFDEIDGFLNSKKEIFNQIEMMDDEQSVVTYQGNYSDTINQTCLSWSEDTHNYIIALIEN